MNEKKAEGERPKAEGLNFSIEMTGFFFRFHSFEKGDVMKAVWKKSDLEFSTEGKITDIAFLSGDIVRLMAELE